MKQAQGEVASERLLDEFNSVVTETEQLLKSIATASSDKAVSMRASMQDSLAAAGERVARIREQSIRQAGDAVRATDDYVQANAWQVIGIAAGVAALAGLIAGIAIARR
ncbi:MAG: DUF883 domain-containing protein [Usitatibacter sp.]